MSLLGEPPKAPLRPTLAWQLIFGALAVIVGVETFFLYPTPKAVPLAVALLLMVACAWYDLTEFRVPNLFTYAGTVLILATALFMPGAGFAASIAGAVVGGLVLLALSIVSRGTIGLGDAKLVAFGGSVVGLENLLPALLVGSVSAMVPITLLLLGGRISRKQALPYAPALALGFVAVALMSGSSLRL